MTKIVRRFSWPLDTSADDSNGDNNPYNIESSNNRYIDIDNINLMVRLKTFVDDIIDNKSQLCGKHCNQNCRLHCQPKTYHPTTTRLQSLPNRSSFGIREQTTNNDIVIDINENPLPSNEFNIPIVKNIISRIKSSSISISSTLSDSSTTCSSCRARESISSSGSSSSGCGRNVIANENVLSNSLSSNSSDSEVISTISGFSDDHNTQNSDHLLPDEFILRELSEMRSILEQILQNREQMGPDFNHSTAEELFNLFGFSLSDVKRLAPNEGDFPVGPWVYQECGVCLEVGWLNRRHCCQYSACIPCLQQYYSSRIEFGTVTIECINPLCHSYVHRDEISARLSPLMKDVYHRLLLSSSSLSDQTKPCPQCNYFHTISEDVIKLFKTKPKDSTIYRVQCTECQFYWCFKCHSPWHSELSCKQYRKGDRLLKTWAKETNHGQVNAQKCPRCGIYIQRTSGCDHMHCTRCKTDFCYKCGDKLRRLKFFGDHYSKLSIFGCKYRYKADRPLQRKLVRGAVFASKVMLVPILGSLAVCAGAVVLVLGVAVLPLYAAIKIYRKYRNKKHLKTIRHQVVSTISSGVTAFD